MIQDLFVSYIFNFAVSVLGGLVLFVGGYLYIDSSRAHKTVSKPLLLRGFGFLMLAGVYTFHATSINHPLAIFINQTLKIVSLGAIAFSLLAEPFLEVPKTAKNDDSSNAVTPLMAWSLIPFAATLYFIIAAIYYRKMTAGLEKQVRNGVIGFFLLGISEALRIRNYFTDSPVPLLARLSAEFGPAWTAGRVVEFIGLAFLMLWFWGFIRFQLRIQIVTFALIRSFIIFLLTTTFFTLMLTKNIENNTYADLKTNVGVIQYALTSLESKTLAQAQTIAEDSDILETFKGENRDRLYDLSAQFMASQKTSTLIIATESGNVVIRGEDNDRTNDNVSNDPLFVQALSGKQSSTFRYHEAAVFPKITLVAAVPIRDGNRVTGKIIGAVMTGIEVDNAFVDGIKKITGLDASIYGQDKRAATTFLAPDGVSRFTGVKETNKKIIDKVINRGELFLGASKVLNQPYYIAYSPLKSSEGKVIGMLFVGRPQDTLIETSKQAMRETFLGVIIFMAVSYLPLHYFANRLKENIEA